MRIDPSANVDAIGKLADASGPVATEVAVSVTKQVLDATGAAVLELLSSLEPHLGQQVDVRL